VGVVGFLGVGRGFSCRFGSFLLGFSRGFLLRGFGRRSGFLLFAEDFDIMFGSRTSGSRSGLSGGGLRASRQKTSNFVCAPRTGGLCGRGGRSGGLRMGPVGLLLKFFPQLG